MAPKNVALDVRLAESFPNIAANIQTVVFHGSVVSVLENPILHAALHALTDPPVLPIDDVPELNGIGAIEVVLCQFIGVKQEVTLNAGVARGNL